MSRNLLFCLSFICFSCSAVRADIFLDLASVTPGGVGVGAFSGSLGGIAVAGIIVPGSPPSFSFNPTGFGIDSSTIDGSSPQYSYATVFGPITGTLPTGTDRIGWTSAGLATNVVTLTFSSPVTNPVLHVANMDLAQFGFAGTVGLSTLTLLKGNDSGSEGLDFLGLSSPGKFIQDAAPGTSDSTLPGFAPPVSGPRSAYGSVRLNGTFTSLSFGVGTNGPGTDVGGGSFTISVVPEPGSMLLIRLSAMAWAGFVRCRARTFKSRI